MLDKCLFDGVTPSLETLKNLDAMGIEFVILGSVLYEKERHEKQREAPKLELH